MTGVLNEQCSHFSARQLHILSVRLCSKPDLLACCLFPSYSLLLSPHPSTHLYIVICMHLSVSPEHSLHSSVNTHISVSLLEVDGGGGPHVLGLRLEFKLSALN